MGMISAFDNCIWMWAVIGLWMGLAAVGDQPMPLTPENVKDRAIQNAASIAAFLDGNSPMEDRLNAAARVGIPEEEDAGRLLAAAADPMNAEEVRARALILGGRTSSVAAASLAAEILKGKSGGPGLRSLCVRYLGQNLEFSGDASPEVRNQYVRVLRDSISLSEPPEVRQSAVSYLGSKGDEVAVQALKDSITNAEGALLEPVVAIGYATTFDPGLYLREFNTAFNSNDPKMRAATIPVLASYEEFRQKIRATILDEKQPFEVRQAAIQVVGLYAPDVVKDLLKLAGDQSQSEALRAESVLQLRGVQEKFGPSFDKMSPIPRRILDEELRKMMTEKPSRVIADAAAQYFQLR